MKKHLFIRRCIVVLLFLVGPLTQFQVLYACELMSSGNEQQPPSMLCCCDEADDAGQVACEMGGVCQDQTVMMGGCCDITYEPSSVAQAPGTNAQAQQVLLLDAAQPPPLLTAWLAPDMLLTAHVTDFDSRSYVPLSEKPLYLLTRRLRI